MVVKSDFNFLHQIGATICNEVAKVDGKYQASLTPVHVVPFSKSFCIIYGGETLQESFIDIVGLILDGLSFRAPSGAEISCTIKEHLNPFTSKPYWSITVHYFVVG